MKKSAKHQERKSSMVKRERETDSPQAVQVKKRKTSLSGKTMMMKFMVRKEQAEEEEKEKREEVKKVEASQWVIKRDDSRASNKLVCIPDSTVSKPVAVGRRSFGSFNKTVEENAEAIEEGERKGSKKLEDHEAAEEVDDSEMVNRMQRLTGLPTNSKGPKKGKAGKKRRSNKM
jgi:hypothetical protein